MQTETYDISEVCRLLGTTSRTLRFYEQKGLISSARLRSQRRCYTAEQVGHIRDVLVLRSIGLPVRAIYEIQSGDAELRSAILIRRAEIIARMNKRLDEINLLAEALVTVDNGGDISALKRPVSGATTAEKALDTDAYIDEIARVCSAAIISGDTETLYKHIDRNLLECMPREVYLHVREETLTPLGLFKCFGSMSHDDKFRNIIYRFVEFENLFLRIKFVFHDSMVCGLWLNYYESENDAE